METKQISIDLSSRDFHQIFESTMQNPMKICFFDNFIIIRLVRNGNDMKSG